MMQAFRNSAKLAGAIFALLMLVFVLTSVDWCGLSSATTVGKINGQSIDARTYQASCSRRSTTASATVACLTHAGGAHPDRGPGLGAVRSRLSVLECRVRAPAGITVTSTTRSCRRSATRRRRSSGTSPSSRPTASSTSSKYQRWLTSSVAAEYLPDARGAVSATRSGARSCSAWSAADIYLSDAALWEQYRDEHEKVKIALTAIIPRNVVPDSAVKLTDAEIDRYYRSHLDDFKRPATAFLSFVALPRFTNAADYGRRPCARRLRAGRDRGRHSVRRRGAPGIGGHASPRRRAATWASGPRDPWTPRSTPPRSRSRSRRCRSRCSRSSVTTSSRSPAGRAKKAKGRHILFPIEVAGAHRDQLDARADSLERLAAERDGSRRHLDAAAKRAGAPGRQVRAGAEGNQGPGRATWSCRTPESGRSRPQEGATSPVIETSVAYYVFRLDSLQAEGIPPLAQIRSAVAYARAERQEARAGASEVAQDYMKRLESGASMADAAKALNLPHREFGPFSRVNPPLTDPIVIGHRVRSRRRVSAAGCSTPRMGSTSWRLLEHVKADSAQFVKELDEYRGRTMSAGAAGSGAWLPRGAARQSAKVVDNRAKLQQQIQQQQQQAAGAAAGDLARDGPRNDAGPHSMRARVVSVLLRPRLLYCDNRLGSPEDAVRLRSERRTGGERPCAGRRSP